LAAKEAEDSFPRRTVSKLGLILKQKEDGTLKKRISSLICGGRRAT